RAPTEPRRAGKICSSGPATTGPVLVAQNRKGTWRGSTLTAPRWLPTAYRVGSRVGRENVKAAWWQVHSYRVAVREAEPVDFLLEHERRDGRGAVKGDAGQRACAEDRAHVSGEA